MKINGLSKHNLSHAVSMGLIHMNTPFSGGGATGGVSFGGAPQLTQAPAAAAQAPPTPQTPAPASSGIVPGMVVEGATPNPADLNNGMGNTAPATGGQTPLDEYAKLYDNKPTDKGAATPPDVLAAPMTDYQTAAGKLDFTSGLDPEVAKAALGGDVESLMTLINGAARNAFAQSSYSSSQVTKAALNTRMDSMKAGLPEMLRKQQANSGIVDNNAALKHPAVQPLVQAVQSQLAQQYPEATPQELEAHTVKYMQGMSSLFAQAPEDTQLPEGATADEGWDDYFNN